MADRHVEIVAKGVMASNGALAKNVANVFHYRTVISANPIIKANIEAAFQAAIMAPVLLATSDDYGQDGTTVRFYDDAIDPPQLFAEAGVGNIATDRMPDYNTVVIQMHTPYKGKSYRGSKHFAGVVEASTTGDILTGTGVTLWNAVRDALLNGFTDSDGNVWIPEIKSNKPPAQYLVNPVTVVANDVTSTILNLTLGIMKRRKVKTVV